MLRNKKVRLDLHLVQANMRNETRSPGVQHTALKAEWQRQHGGERHMWRRVNPHKSATCPAKWACLTFL